jgi:hypothetical protein
VHGAAALQQAIEREEWSWRTRGSPEARRSGWRRLRRPYGDNMVDHELQQRQKGKAHRWRLGPRRLDYFSRETLEDEAEPMEHSPGLGMARDGRAQCCL